MDMNLEDSGEEFEQERPNPVQYQSCLHASKDLFSFTQACVRVHGGQAPQALRKMRTQVESPKTAEPPHSDLKSDNAKLVPTVNWINADKGKAQVTTNGSRSSVSLRRSRPRSWEPQEEIGLEGFQQLVSTVMGNYLKEKLCDPKVKELYLSYAGALAAYKGTRKYAEIESRGETIRGLYRKDFRRFSGTLKVLIAVGQKTLIIGLEDVLADISAIPVDDYDEEVNLSHGSSTLGTVSGRRLSHADLRQVQARFEGLSGV